MKRIALVGFGTIGQYLFRHINSQADIQVSCVYEANNEIAKTIPDNVAVDTQSKFVDFVASNKIDLVVETATHQAVKDLAPEILRYSNIVVFSTCAFADEEFEAETMRLCKQYSRKIYIPHGAILGLDGIRDGRQELQSVSITTIKRPANLGVMHTEKTVLFDGATRSACKLYPRNVNVHASIAIAGLGFDRTRSRVIADPNSEGNVHIIDTILEGMRFKIEVCSNPLGLVTGAYTPVSAFNSISKLFGGSGYTII